MFRQERMTNVFLKKQVSKNNFHAEKSIKTRRWKFSPKKWKFSTELKISTKKLIFQYCDCIDLGLPFGCWNSCQDSRKKISCYPEDRKWVFLKNEFNNRSKKVEKRLQKPQFRIPGCCRVSCYHIFYDRIWWRQGGQLSQKILQFFPDLKSIVFGQIQKHGFFIIYYSGNLAVESTGTAFYAPAYRR